MNPAVPSAACLMQGRRTPATVVYHIDPHKGDKKLFWDSSAGRAIAGRRQRRVEDLETEHQTCVCDQCMTRLLIKGCSKIRKHDNGIKQHYIKCPRCRAEYTSFYTKEDIRRVQHRISKMFALPRNMKKESAVDLYSKKIETAQTEIQTAMNQLKKEMETPHL